MLPNLYARLNKQKFKKKKKKILKDLYKTLHDLVWSRYKAEHKNHTPFTNTTLDRVYIFFYCQLFPELSAYYTGLCCGMVSGRLPCFSCWWAGQA